MLYKGDMCLKYSAICLLRDQIAHEEAKSKRARSVPLNDNTLGAISSSSPRGTTAGACAYAKSTAATLRAPACHAAPEASPPPTFPKISKNYSFEPRRAVVPRVCPLEEALLPKVASCR